MNTHLPSVVAPPCTQDATRIDDTRIGAVTVADLAAFAQRYFTREQRTQLVVRP